MGLVLIFKDKTGVTEITGKPWPDAKAGEVQTAEKFGFQNVGDRAALANTALKILQVGTGDGNTMARTGADMATLSCPWSLAALLSGAGAGGVWGALGTYGWVVTAYNATGETGRSLEVTVNVDVATKKVTLSWAQVAGATGYKVYRTATPGTYTGSTLRATVVGSSNTTYQDDGSACSAGTPPTANTTGGVAPNYGTPPTLGTADLTIGALAIGKEYFFWVNWVIPAGTPEAGNPRQFDTTIVEA